MTPAFQILADGDDVTAVIADRLIELRVTDEAGLSSDECEIKIDDRDRAVATPRKGAVLTVRLGYRGALARMGAFTVDEVRFGGPPFTLTVAARAANLRKALKAERTRVWKDQTIGGLVGAIAAEHGLTPAAAEPLASTPVEYLAQTEESDLHLLTRLADDHDAVMTVKEERLIFIPRGAAQTVSAGEMPAVSLSIEDLTEVEAVLPDRQGRGKIEARWWSVPLAEEQIATAGEGEVSRRLRRVYEDAASARAAAEAELSKIERDKASLSFACAGDVRLMAETPVTIAGVRGGLDGRWVIKRAEHTLDGSGFKTRVEAEAA